VDIRNKNIVFLHGLGQTSSSWQETITAIKADTDASCPDLSELLLGKEIKYSGGMKDGRDYQRSCHEAFTEI